MEENKLLNTISDPDKVEKDLADSAFDQDWPDDEEISTINRMKSEWDEIETAKEDGIEAQLQGKIKDMHEALEDNEDLVECQNCFDLFPKSECVKVDYGYLCPHCKEIHIIEVPVELVDDATFNLDFDEPEDWYVDEADEISEPVSTVSIDTPVEGEEVIDAPAPEGVTFDLSNGSGAPEEVTVKDGEIINISSDDSSDSGAENIGDKDVEVFLQSTQENKALHENYKIIETGINGDSLVKEGDLVKGVGEIKGEENGEEYYDSIEFEYQPEIDSVKITKIDPIFSATEIAEAEKDLLDNLKTNFQESLKEEKETEEVPETHEGQMEFLVKDEDEAIDGYDKVIEKTDNEHLAGELEHIRDEEIAHKEFLEIAKENPDATYEHVEEKVEENLKEEAANVDHYELHFKNPEDEKTFGGLDQFKSKDDAYAKSLEYLDGGHPCEIKKLICNGDICSLVDLDEPNRVNEKLEEKAMVEPAFDSDAKVGDKIRIIHLEGEDNSYDGKEGEVEHIDGIGQLHGTWGGLAVIPGVDDFEIINENLKEDISTPELIDTIELGPRTIGDGPYYDGDGFIYILKNKDNKYYAEYAVENENGPIEDPEYIEEAGDFDNVEDLMKALKETHWIDVDESLEEDADVDYVEYVHSYCNALEPHMDELRKIEDVEELKKAILNIINEDPDVNTTEKKNKFVWLIKNKKWSSTKNIMAYLDKAMNKAKGIEVKVDGQGELIKKENLEEANYAASATHTEEIGLGTFEAEDQKDAENKAERLYKDGTFDSYWDETDFEVKKVDEELNENKVLTDFVQNEMSAGKSIDEIINSEEFLNLTKEEGKKDLEEDVDLKNRFNAALAKAKEEHKPVIYGYFSKEKYNIVDPIVCDDLNKCRSEFMKKYHPSGSILIAYPDKTFQEGIEKIESLEFTCDQDLADDRTPAKAEEPELGKPLSDSEMRKHEAGIKEDVENPAEVFTLEEQDEYACDEDGYCLDSHDQLHHCGWCGDVYTESEMRHETDFGWICSRCEDDLKAHGGPLTFIENEKLDK